MKRVGLVWHGDRETRDHPCLDEHRLGPTAEALRSEGLAPEAAVYNDDFADEVRDQLLKVDVVLVWVNPIESGRDRTKLDAMLQEVAYSGVLVSAHPRTIKKMGTKDALFHTREMGWGSDVRIYHLFDEFAREFPKALQAGRPRVLKQWRGHSGQGVWKVTPQDAMTVKTRHAQRGCVEETVALDGFLDSCRPYFAGEGHMVDQEYNERISEGTVRCYLVQDRVEGFGYQPVNALVEGEPAPGQRAYSPPNDQRFQSLKQRLEGEWLGQMMELLGVSFNDLPLLWDADFMFAPPPREWMLCEINVSSVYPYPESAMAPLARALQFKLSLT